MAFLCYIRILRYGLLLHDYLQDLNFYDISSISDSTQENSLTLIMLPQNSQCPVLRTVTFAPHAGQMTKLVYRFGY